MIDLHCHVLPGLDDGAQTLEDSIELARVAAGDGIHTIVATPHADLWGANPDEQDLERRVAQLQTALDEQGIPVRILPGLENHLSPELLAGKVVPINHTQYLLVELPFEEFPFYAENALFELQLKGFTPIIAHPERNVVLRSQPNVLCRLVDRGIMSQLTAASLLGLFGRKTRDACEHFLRMGFVHVLSTDAHSASGGRRPILTDAVAAAARVIGREHAEALVTTIPEKIVNGQPVELPLMAEEARPRRWAFWR